MANNDKLSSPGDWPEVVRRMRARTPARLLTGRTGAAYRTATQLELRQAHAAARDAVRAELDLEKQFAADFIKQWGLFEVSSEANSKDEYLLQPNLGRSFSAAARAELARRCPPQTDLQIAIGDGLSVTAVLAQVPHLLPALRDGAKVRGWTIGQVFVIRHCRVGILNEIGELLNPVVALLLIGERPGLATAESLSAYMAYRPQPGNTDADRNLISNIHARGIRAEDAATRILDLAAKMMEVECSGTRLGISAPMLGKDHLDHD
jgi:ethanolamine ammonia-lyase small subunit